jgi:isopentenyl-diphosphate Delta-isomerase
MLRRHKDFTARKRGSKPGGAVGDLDVPQDTPMEEAPGTVTPTTAIESRKGEHLALALESGVEARSTPGWEDVQLIHEAVPELSPDRVDLSTELVGHALRLPLVIAGMTGGHPDAASINTTLARAAERNGIAMGVGSQRAALVDPRLAYTYRGARDEAPGALLIANVGAAQLVPQKGQPPLGVDGARRAVEMIGADALAVHLNFLEESVQPEGDRNASGCLDAIESLAGLLEVPVVAK